MAIRWAIMLPALLVAQAILPFRQAIFCVPAEARLLAGPLRQMGAAAATAARLRIVARVLVLLLALVLLPRPLLGQASLMILAQPSSILQTMLVSTIRRSARVAWLR